MAKELLTRCGYRCDLCLAFQENIQKNDQRKALADGWFRCYGFTVSADKMYCEGCLTPGTPKLIDAACPVRPCVLARGLDNCSQCEEYPCDKFVKRQVIFEEVARGKQLSANDRELFIRPYENKVRLDELRARHQER